MPICSLYAILSLPQPNAPGLIALVYKESEMSSTPQPPVAQRISRTVIMHGDTRDDPYYWLRDRANPAVIAYLNR